MATTSPPVCAPRNPRSGRSRVTQKGDTVRRFRHSPRVARVGTRSYASGVPKTVYTVVQAEHMGAIASDLQLASYARIWNDPDNADLRKRRDVPHVLLPGDVVTIADRDPRIFERPTGKQHVFTVNLMPLKLRVVALDPYGNPIASKAGTLRIDGSDDQDIQTDGDGKFEATIENGTRAATLTLGDQTYQLAIGHLDPIDEPSGQLGRLKVLGYFDGDVPEAAEFIKKRSDIEDAMAMAWELFQDENGLPVTGQPDDDSVKKLQEVFGDAAT